MGWKTLCVALVGLTVGPVKIVVLLLREGVPGQQGYLTSGGPDVRKDVERT